MSDPIRSHVLHDGDTEITVLSLGCAVQDWRVAGRRVVLGYADPESYRSNPPHLGVVVGRVANRVAGARFALEGQTWSLPANDGANHLHGGAMGFARCNWRMTPEGPRAVRLDLTSPDGDMGYPGALQVTVRMSLQGSALTWQMWARPDRATPVNLAQHLYFNLAGGGDIRSHSLRIAADHVTPTRPDLIPTGELLDVTGTRYDFRRARQIGQADPDAAGYDLNFALNGAGPQSAVGAATRDAIKAEVRSPDGMRLRLWTDQPGLQLYTASMLKPSAAAWPELPHQPFGGLCLEAQGFPDAVNQAGFPNVICAADRPYHQATTIEITPD